tara:strand:+ start:1060 stop:2334 length:1275 start_codon:yes stop_codon:yes gene_type:complete
MLYKTISVVGLGYIGLPTAAMFASKGINVIGVDINAQAVKTINSGKIHIIENGLEKIVSDTVKNKFLKADISFHEADAFLVAVPTPFKKSKLNYSIPEPDLSYIKKASKEIAKVLKKGNLVILESTSPVGTTEKMINWMREERSDLKFPDINTDSDFDINIAYCPERVMPGNIIHELIENDRVIGGITKDCSAAASYLYKKFVKGKCIETDARTAEMVKLTENASRDVSIAFANELSIICEDLDINVWELINLANRHPRVNILQPGPGVGGHCIAVDPWFIVNRSPNLAKLIKQARDINDGKPSWVIEKVKSTVLDVLQSNQDRGILDIKIACFGLAFKADIDDLRESPAMEITSKLSEWHSDEIMIVEPNIKKLPQSLTNCRLVDSHEAITKSDIIVLLVDHKEFFSIDFSNKNLIDTKGIKK